MTTPSDNQKLTPSQRLESFMARFRNDPNLSADTKAQFERMVANNKTGAIDVRKIDLSDWEDFQ